MKRVLVRSGLLIAWAVLSLVVASQWMAHPDLFPPLPTSLWQWVDRWYETHNAEQVADMEFIVVLMISAAGVLLGMLGALALFKQRHRPNQGG